MIAATAFQLKYRVLNKIGEGSFSDVVKCEDILTGKLYAAKRLRKIYRSENEMVCCAEVKAIEKVKYHPNIIRMIEYFYDSLGGRIIFILELMDISLYDYIKTKKRCISENKAKFILYQVLKGLEHLHKSGVFHRDVKSENILMKLPTFKSSAKEIVKLADLGSIRGIYSRPPYTEYISTRWYRPPECLLTVGHYGPKMDVWAIGCVFYEVLTLKPLFAGSDEINQLARIHAVLGTPSPSLINKLRSKSRNCIYFPKQKGSGIESVVKAMSENGLAVLKLMIQYDPERRISVKRLVQHVYFKDLREQDEVKRHNSIHAKTQEFLYHQNKGDGGTTPNLSTFTMKQPNSLVKNILPNGTANIEKSKTSVNMSEYEIPLKSKTNNLSGRPVARNSEIRAWGLNPYILKSKDKPTKVKTTHYVKIKKPLQRNDKQKMCIYSKTTSALPQKNGLQVNTIKLQSKSFACSTNKDL